MDLQIVYNGCDRWIMLALLYQDGKIILNKCNTNMKICLSNHQYVIRLHSLYTYIQLINLQIEDIHYEFTNGRDIY